MGKHKSTGLFIRCYNIQRLALRIAQGVPIDLPLTEDEQLANQTPQLGRPSNYKKMELIHRELLKQPGYTVPSNEAHYRKILELLSVKGASIDQITQNKTDAIRKVFDNSPRMKKELKQIIGRRKK